MIGEGFTDKYTREMYPADGWQDHREDKPAPRPTHTVTFVSVEQYQAEVSGLQIATAIIHEAKL